jgi:hypothetical protein
MLPQQTSRPGRAIDFDVSNRVDRSTTTRASLRKFKIISKYSLSGHGMMKREKERKALLLMNLLVDYLSV